MALNSTETITSYLERILESVHPLMAESLYLAAVPIWFDRSFFAAIRHRDDGREEGLISRLARYSFVVPLEEDGEGDVIYTVRHAERKFIQRHWIIKDPPAYRNAHQRALEYWIANPDSNPFAQAQNRLYHELFVDVQSGMDFLVDRFRAYHGEHQLSAIDSMLKTVVEARFYLALLDARALDELDDLLTHLRARLAQLRGNWTESVDALQSLRAKPQLAPWLLPYVARAYGNALTQTGRYVEAIEQHSQALELFNKEATTITVSASVQAERAHTMIFLGDAHVALASSIHGRHERAAPAPGQLQQFRDFFYFFLSLPLVFYLSFYLGRRVWHPRFWPTLNRLDWIIARLFATGANLFAKADPVLEAHGTPAEGVVADQQLANLYLAMGDAEQAQMLYLRLLIEEEAPLGEYRRAAIRVGLAKALLGLGRYGKARVHLEAALPVLALYEDVSLLADSEMYLAEALLESGDTAGSITFYTRALQSYIRHGNEIRATEAAERLEALEHDERVEAAQQSAAAKAAGELTLRRYPVRYRHPATVFFQRAAIGSAAALIFLILVSIVRMETGIALSPEITFNASPLLRSDAPGFTPALSQGIVALKLTTIPNPELLVWLGIVLFLAYMVISTGIGILAIVRTSLAKVQARAQTEEIRFDGVSLQVGSGETRRTLSLKDVTHFYLADLRFVNELMVDDSGITLVAPEQRFQLRGNITWYPALRERIAGLLPDTAEKVDLSYSILRSRMGVFYLVTIGALLLLSLLGLFVTQVITFDIPGLSYSLADLYPYLYLGLFLPPVSWFIFRPLRVRLHSDPLNRFPWWIGGAGAILALVRVGSLFRPWLTIPDIFVPLTIASLVIGAGVVIWKAQRPGTAHPVYPFSLRMGVATVMVAISVVMGIYFWREAGSYHYFILGNAWRDKALRHDDSAEKEVQLKRALDAYDRAVKIAEIEIIGLSSQFALDVPFGIPTREEFTWFMALNHRAATASQLENYGAAIDDYTRLLKYSDANVELYADRAVAYLGLGTAPGDAMGTMDVTRRNYSAALVDFDTAVALDPGNAELFLWRGVTHHALGDLDHASADYDEALRIQGDAALDAVSQAKAWTGKGWIAYVDSEYSASVELFQRATEVETASAEARLGLGYAYFSLRQLEQALQTWGEAAQLDPTDPSVLISLGTLYWRVGTLGDDFSASGSDRCFTDALSTSEKNKSAEQLELSIENLRESTTIPGQEPEEVAFTYRTMAHVQYLLRNCPEYDTVKTLEGAVDYYSQAIQRDPDNAGYWHFRGRLSYAIWSETPPDAGPIAREWLFMGLDDTDKALALDPVDRGDYAPNAWRETIWNEAVIGSISQGDLSFSEGEYDLALAYYELVAEHQTDHAEAAFKAGLAALSTGAQEQATQWYTVAIDRALASDDEVVVQEAFGDLRVFLGTQDGAAIKIEAIEGLFEDSGIGFDRPRTADVAFAWGLAALQAGRTDEAKEYYEQGLALAVDTKNIATVAAALLELHSVEMGQNLIPQFRQALSGLETVTSEDETAVDEAFKLALIAVAVGEDATAGTWYNEGVRRSAANSHYPPIQDSRADLRDLWAATGVNSDAILAQMQRSLPNQLRQHQELEENGLYWRFRAWFKYGLGLSAFRLGEEEAAASALRAAQVDAARAFELDNTGNAYVQTYLAESAWGWYHVERGDDYSSSGKFDAALADYEAAVALIVPVANADARTEIAIAAFKAGQTALLLDEIDRAKTWYEQGLALKQKYQSEDFVLNNAISDLESLLQENPDIASVAEAILVDLEQAR
jgi:tetratricopeptide (TPR) repeat protein